MKFYCFNCKCEVSEKATACPKCGHPLTKPKTPLVVVSGKPKWVIASIAISAVLASIAWYAWRDHKPDINIITAQPQPVVIDNSAHLRERIRTRAYNSSGEYPSSEFLDHGVKIALEIMSHGRFTEDYISGVIAVGILRDGFLTRSIPEWEKLIDATRVLVQHENKSGEQYNERLKNPPAETRRLFKSDSGFPEILSECEGTSESDAIAMGATLIEAFRWGKKPDYLLASIHATTDQAQHNCIDSVLSLAHDIVHGEPYPAADVAVKEPVRATTDFTVQPHEPKLIDSTVQRKEISHQQFDAEPSEYLALKTRTIRVVMKDVDRLVSLCGISHAYSDTTNVGISKCEKELYRSGHFRGPVKIRMSVDSTLRSSEGLKLLGSCRIQNRNPDLDYMSDQNRIDQELAYNASRSRRKQHKDSKKSVSNTRKPGSKIKSTKRALRSHRKNTWARQKAQADTNDLLYRIGKEVENRKNRFETIHLSVFVPNSEKGRYDFTKLANKKKLTAKVKVKSVTIHPPNYPEAPIRHPAYVEKLNCVLISLP